MGDQFLDALIETHPEADKCSPSRLKDFTREFLLSQRTSLCYDTRTASMLSQISSMPEWVDMAAVRRGMRVYLKYSFSGHLALLFYSLIGGFSAPKITSVLDATGYLTRGHDQIWRRLLETFEMVVECISDDDALNRDGAGFLSIIHVRMLHSRVRRRILSDPSSWDMQTNGMPINQADMLVTLLSFSINVLEVIKKIGAPFLSKADEEDYLMLWRTIGYFLGVDPTILTRHCSSLELAHGAMESLVLDLLHPNQHSQQIASNILLAVSNRPPLFWNHGVNCSLAHQLLGPELSKALKLPKPSFFTSFDRLTALWVVFFASLLNILIPLFFSSEKAVARKRTIMQAVLDKQLQTSTSSSLKRSSSSGCPFAPHVKTS